MGKKKGLPEVTPLNSDDYHQHFFALGIAHQDNPDLREELYGGQMPPGDKVEKIITTMQARFTRTFR